MMMKNRIFHSLLIVSTIMLIDLCSFGIATAADSTQIIIDENLKAGMTLKDAIQLLGPPESIKISDTGTVIIPYDSLGLSIEVLNDGTVIEGVHLQSTFKGKFSSGLGMGVDYKEILAAYNQPDVMTKDRIEYSDNATVFQISQGKLVGANLHSAKGTLLGQMPIKETGTYEAQKAEKVEDEEAGENEDEITKEDGEYDVFDLYGFKVKNTNNGVVITEIRPASVAENGGLKVGESIRKAFYKGTGVRNIYSVSGLETILKRAVDKRKKMINILQNENQYYKIEVPKRN
jgi:hypothetical protein